MSTLQPTYAEAISNASRVLATAYSDLAQLPPRQSAERAYVPGGPSVDELEQRIKARLAAAPAADRAA